HFFACPKYPPSNLQVKLPHFIAYALHRTKSHSSSNFRRSRPAPELEGRFILR
ncbi:hypothetical protein DFJ58DRAFT_657278, partial [Suillus subalutaceus]|uniref:uncharacterized protein n=1 Tax=Suillus subalutaceus TaxID=48586 RepID=UPI001B85E956